jgi:hypothetical protein
MKGRERGREVRVEKGIKGNKSEEQTQGRRKPGTREELGEIKGRIRGTTRFKGWKSEKKSDSGGGG